MLDDVAPILEGRDRVTVPRHQRHGLDFDQNNRRRFAVPAAAANGEDALIVHALDVVSNAGVDGNRMAMLRIDGIRHVGVVAPDHVDDAVITPFTHHGAPWNRPLKASLGVRPRSADR